MFPVGVGAPGHPHQPQEMLHEEGQVEPYDDEPEIPFAERLIQPAAAYLGEPVINAGEKSEDCARRNDVMEMRDDIVSVVQIKVG